MIAVNYRSQNLSQITAFQCCLFAPPAKNNVLASKVQKLKGS